MMYKTCLQHRYPILVLHDFYLQMRISKNIMLRAIRNLHLDIR